MMMEHRIPPTEFLDFVHDLDLDQIRPEPALDAAIAALPGRKVVFTNATVKYAIDVMDRLGVGHHFDVVFDVAAADYIPKPQMSAYDQFFRATNVAPKRAIFFEDMARNLAPAAQSGMTTVWVENERLNAGPTRVVRPCPLHRGRSDRLVAGSSIGPLDDWVFIARFDALTAALGLAKVRRKALKPHSRKGRIPYGKLIC